MKTCVIVQVNKDKGWLDRVGLLLNGGRYLEGLTRILFLYTECNNFILAILRRVSNLDMLFTCRRGVAQFGVLKLP